MSESKSRERRREKKLNGSDPMRRLGRIDMMEGLIADYPIAVEIFNQIGFVPWNVEYDERRQVFHMMGSSHLFREKTLDEPAPYYKVRVSEGPLKNGWATIQVVVEEDRGMEPVVTTGETA